VDAVLAADEWRKRLILVAPSAIIVASIIPLWRWSAWFAPLLAAEGWRAWLNDLLTQRLPLMIACGIALLALLQWRLERFCWFLALVPPAITGFDLISFSRWFLPQVPNLDALPRSPLVEYLDENLGHDRFATYGKGFLSGSLPPDTGAVYGLASIDGYDPMNIARYGRLLDQVAEGKLNPLMKYSTAGPFIAIETPSSPIVDLLGLRFLLTEGPIMGLGSIGDAGWSLAYSGPDGLVYRNFQALPPAFFLWSGGKFFPTSKCGWIASPSGTLIQRRLRSLIWNLIPP